MKRMPSVGLVLLLATSGAGVALGCEREDIEALEERAERLGEEVREELPRREHAEREMEEAREEVREAGQEVREEAREARAPRQPTR